MTTAAAIKHGYYTCIGSSGDSSTAAAIKHGYYICMHGSSGGRSTAAAARRQQSYTATAYEHTLI
jgi:hypothetical protein